VTVRPLLIVAVLVAACSSSGDDPSTVSVSGDSVALSALDGATMPSTFVLEVDVAEATTARLVIDGNYVGRDDTVPLRFVVDVAPGRHELRVRTTGGGGEERVEAAFTAGGWAPYTTVTTVTSTAPPTTPTPPAAGATIVVDSVEAIRAALETAPPGAVIEVADGEYEFRPRLVASASGTPDAPITLRGSRAAVLRTRNVSGDYGLHVTGDHWRIVGLTVDWTDVERLYDAVGLPPMATTTASRVAVPVFAGSRQIGFMSSSTWSPILKKMIGLATVEAAFSGPGSRLEVEHTVDAVRHLVRATVTPTPFFKPPRKTATP